MRTNRHAETVNVIEARLRREAPPLRPTDPQRVDRACARLHASTPARSPLSDVRTFTRPLLRLAACAALLLAAALLLRQPPADRRLPAPALATPPLPHVASFRDLAAILQREDVAGALAGEADGLSTDLTALSDALNARTFAILF